MLKHDKKLAPKSTRAIHGIAVKTQIKAGWPQWGVAVSKNP